MSALPTIHDVARMAGVSRQTVSNVLNTPAIVRPATRERVEAAISSLGYRPHESARRLRTRKSSTIGIRIDPMSDGISGSVLDRFLHALTEQAARQGLRVMLFTATDPLDEIRQFARLRDGADVDAFVLTSTFHGDPRTEWLIANDQTFVTFGRPWGIDDLDDPAHPWVDVDGWWGLHEATLALLEMLPDGRRRVGYIGWPSPSGTGDDRHRGWRDAMLERSGLTATEIDALARAVPDGVSTGGAALRELLALPRPGADAGPGDRARTGIAGSAAPDARHPARAGSAGTAAESGDRTGEGATAGIDGVLCASDSLALGALIASGGRVPVIGYDNTPVAAALGLSSVEQPLDEVAAGVLELLTGGPATPGPASESDDLRGPHAPTSDDSRHRLVRPRLVLRTPEPISITT